MFFKSALMGFRSGLSDGLLGRALTIGVRQQKVIQEQREVIERMGQELVLMNLENTRNVRNLVEHFLIVQSDGIDVRDELIDGLRDLNDHVARLEEHVS